MIKYSQEADVLRELQGDKIWVGIYSSMMAIQVTERAKRGIGAPDDATFSGWMEIARVVADAEARMRAKTTCGSAPT